MIREAIDCFVRRQNLTESGMAACMNEIMEGKVTDAQIGSFLTALHMKGETIGEITGAARVMREKAIRINAPAGTIDTCGTGGDMTGTFNISTASALVLAAAGIPVAKHGNRSVSSRSGSADVLEALGIKTGLEPKKVETCLFETNFGFLFAPLFHPAMKFAVNPRREIGIRTVFNILGPLTNPAGAERQVMGVFAYSLTEILATVLCALGSVDAMVVHGKDGLDEISICEDTRVSRCIRGKVETYTLGPVDFGLKRCSPVDLAGGDRYENAAIIRSVLKGEPGAKLDIVIANAAAGFVVAEKVRNLKEGVERARETILSGKAARKLDEIAGLTNRI